MEEWLCLRNLVDRLESKTAYGEVDSISQRLLEWVYVRVKRPEPLFVQEIILKSEVASPATLHKCIATLSQYGLLQVNADPIDNRRRQVDVTPLCLKLMRELSKGVVAWTDSLDHDRAERSKKR